MNCTEFKIWLETASDEEIMSVDSQVQTHVDNCNICKATVTKMQGVIVYMNEQKKLDLSDSKSAEIIDKLYEIQQTKKSFASIKMFIYSKIAVAAIIVFGVMLGVVAGTIISSTVNNSSPWSNEFTLLSDNTDINALVFE
jgi:predicted anti-sigma-YlaC factor YlaD